MSEDPDRIMTTAAVSAETGIPEATLRYWRHRDEGPESFKLGRRVVYKRSAVNAWIAAQQLATTRGGAA